MEFPDDLRYTTEDEWVLVEDGECKVGVTDYAQDQLGDVVFIELPEVGTAVTHGEPFGVIESVKAVSDLFAPLSGEIRARNERLADEPELVNSSPYGDGWMIRIRLASPAELEGLLGAAEYRARVSEG